MIDSRFRVCVLGASALLGATVAGPIHASQDEQQLRSDCRAEGEAVGLANADLDRFVADCVADLKAVQLSNVDE